MNITDCHHCGATVRSKKASQSGASFCSQKDCQAAKARFFRKRWKTGLTVDRDSDVCRAYIRRAMHDPRQRCPVCGLEDGVSPYIHRNAEDPGKPCMGLGGIGPNEGIPAYWVDIVHPELADRARKPEPVEDQPDEPES